MPFKKPMSDTSEEAVRKEIRSFVNEGSEDVRNGFVYDAEGAFNEIKRLYSELEQGINSLKSGQLYTIEEVWKEIDSI